MIHFPVLKGLNVNFKRKSKSKLKFDFPALKNDFYICSTGMIWWIFFTKLCQGRRRRRIRRRTLFRTWKSRQIPGIEPWTLENTGTNFLPMSRELLASLLLYVNRFVLDKSVSMKLYILHLFNKHYYSLLLFEETKRIGRVV